MKKKMNKPISDTFVCDKLIRHKDPERMIASGMIAKTHVLSAEERILYLKKKILEEAQEAQQIMPSKKLISELTDIYEAMICLLEALGVDLETFARHCQEKKNSRGSYSHGICLDTITIPRNHEEWVHYHANASKYPIF